MCGYVVLCCAIEKRYMDMAYMEYDQFFYDGKIEDFASSLQNESDMRDCYDKNALYCPECHDARLRFTRKTSKHRAFLSTWRGCNHAHGCSHNYEPASKQQIKEYYKSLRPEQVTDKLKAAINAMIRREQRRPLGHTESGSDQNPALAKIINNGTEKIYRLPTRTLANIRNIYQEDFDIPILFYGKALLRVEKKPPKDKWETPYYFLCICDQSNGREIQRFYRGNHCDDVNENQVYFVSLIGISNDTKRKIELYPGNSLLYQSVK